MALLHRPVRGAGSSVPVGVSRETSSSWPGLGLAAAGVLVAWSVHRLAPWAPMLTVSVVLGIAAAHLPVYGASYGAPRARGSPWPAAA